MKMKKCLLSFVLAICLIVPAMFMLSACGDKHTHALTKVDETSETCTTAGNTAYYTCECGKYFSDEKGETEIEKDSWIISATGHDYVATEWYDSDHDFVKTKVCSHDASHKLENMEIEVSTSTELKNAIQFTESNIKIALINDISFDDFTDFTTVNSGNSLLRINREKDVTINLKGHKLTATQTTAISGYTAFIHVQDDAKLTINDTVGTGEISYAYNAGETSDYTGDATIWCEGTLITNNIAIKIDMRDLDSLAFAVDLRPNIWNSQNIAPETPASYTMNNGKVWASNADCIRVCNNSGLYAAHQLVTVSINGGTLEAVDGYGSGIFAHQLDSLFNPIKIEINENSTITGYYAVRVYTQESAWTIADGVTETKLHDITISASATLTDTVEVNGTTTVNTNTEGVVLRCGDASVMDDYRQLTYVNNSVVTIAQ